LRAVVRANRNDSISALLRRASATAAKAWIDAASLSATGLARQVLMNERESKLSSSLEAPPMFDVLFIVVTIGFFAITLAYTAACERL
jgi:hypothetical protein